MALLLYTILTPSGIIHERMDILLSSAYLAPVQYYTKLQQCGSGIAYIEGCDSYVKQTYRNRCVIADAKGPLALTIPTEKGTPGKCLMRDIRISDHGNWRHQHWNALEAAYRHTPFFQYYEDDFRPFYEKKIPFLYEFNIQLTQLVADLIGLEATLKPTDEYRHSSDGNADFRALITPRVSWEADAAFHPTPYYQVFKEKHGFLPNLSIIDLLFNMGPESIIVLNSPQYTP